jgi:hypothetical protein
MSCESCITGPRGQAEELARVRQLAKQYAQAQEKTVAIYREGLEFRYCEHDQAIANRMLVVEVVSQH